MRYTSEGCRLPGADERDGGDRRAPTADEYPTSPNWPSVTSCRPGSHYDDEFETGLDLILDALERAVGTP